jgi:transglutaminase-like putative cysteine protease
MSPTALRICLALVILGAAGGLSAGTEDAAGPALDPGQPYTARKSNPVTYQVDFSVVITAPAGTKLLRAWLPMPQSDSAQEVTEISLETFPNTVKPKIGKEKLFGNRFAYFAFERPAGAQVIRHKFKIKTWELHWDLDPARVKAPPRWPTAFAPYLRDERLIFTGGPFRKLATEIVPRPQGTARDLEAVLSWVEEHMRYDHGQGSLQANAVHALEKGVGHCSDYHGLCAALGRTLGFPTRVAYGISPLPKASPSHCKLEAFLPPYGWVCFDVSETQLLLKHIREDPKLDAAQKERLARAAQQRLLRGFRDNTWFGQTKGTDYDLEPPARRRVPVVRTLYAEADGEALPDPDPANPAQRKFAWMTVHKYVPDRPATSPFHDYRSLTAVEK